MPQASHAGTSVPSVFLLMLMPFSLSFALCWRVGGLGAFFMIWQGCAHVEFMQRLLPSRVDYV